MRYFILGCLLVCSQVFGFNVDPNQKLPTNITYTCQDPTLEQDFLLACCTWNLACNNIFTITRNTDGNPTILVTNLGLHPVPIAGSFELGATQRYGNTAVIIIVKESFAVMLHEVGHAFGMDHNEFYGYAAMYPKNNPPWLSSDDVNGICSIYGQSPIADLWTFDVKRSGKKIMVNSSVAVTWDWGDGTQTYNAIGKTIHKYPAKGYYDVKCIHNHIMSLKTIHVR